MILILLFYHAFLKMGMLTFDQEQIFFQARSGQTFQQYKTFTICKELQIVSGKGGTLQDYELIKRICQGEKQLFGQLVEKYYDDVFRYCYYQTGNEHTAYDCTQETFYHLMRFLDNYRERNHFKSYLIRIASNVCRDYFRQSSRRTVREVSYNQWADNDEPGKERMDSPSTVGAEQESLLRLSIKEGLMHLPESQREVIVLYYYQGYKLREIASLTGVPLSTVKTRLYAGTEKLKQYLREEGGLM